MRILVGLLLIINLLLFYWISQEPDSADSLASEISTNMPPLTLLDEQSSALAQDETSEVLNTAKSADTNEPRAVFLELACYSLGPFVLESSVKSASYTLKDLGLVTVKRYETRRELSGFWVYIPPLPSRADASKVVSMLKQRGVKDYLIVPNGVKKYAISLGFFRTREGAQQRQAHMQALGLAPILEESYRESSGFWLDFTSPNTPPLPDSIVDALQSQYDGISMKKRQCLE